MIGEKYHDSLILKRNTDSQGNPVSINIVDIKPVMDNHSCIVLSQIPDEYHGLSIEGYSEVFDVENVGAKDYKVDYANGVVYFNPVNIGKTITIDYKGIGCELIYCSRVASKLDAYGNVIETLEEMIEKGKNYLKLIETLGNAVTIINKLELEIKEGQTLYDLLHNDIAIGKPLQETLHSDIVEASKWKDQLHKDVADGKVLQPLLQQTVDDAEDVKVRLDKSIADAQEDIATIEATGNEEVIIKSSDWVLNGDIYEKEITHHCNSENLHVTAKNSDTKEACTIGYKILDKTRILLKSDEAINMSIILSASYYHATQTISDDVAEEVLKARKGETGLDVKITKIDEQLDNIENKQNDINYNTICQMPPKSGTLSNSFKIIDKFKSNGLYVIQRSNKGYLMHSFNKDYGDTSSNSVGTSWELLRLIKSEQLLDCFVWHEPTYTSGSVTISTPPSTFNVIENVLLPHSVSDYVGSTGLSLFDLASNESITFEMSTCVCPTMNIFHLCNTNRSDNIEIYVNNVLVSTFSSNKGFSGGSYDTQEFPVPSKATATETYTVKVTNKGTDKFTFVGFNFSRLKDYKGQYVTKYKGYKNEKYFIDSVGASDYAIFDKTLGKWCGSYHGGETANYQKITWNKTKRLGEEMWEHETDFNDISTNTFCVIKDFKIYQDTNLNNKAKMTSIFDFNTDGSINMNYSLYDNIMNTSTIYTALTCTHKDFDLITYPYIGSVTGDNTLNVNNGYVEQYSNDSYLKLGIRFTMFDNVYNGIKPFIRCNDNYSKFYYGILSENDKSFNIPNLTFSKGLDFYNVKL